MTDTGLLFYRLRPGDWIAIKGEARAARIEAMSGGLMIVRFADGSFESYPMERFDILIQAADAAEEDEDTRPMPPVA
jgi:hypothetical protein